MHVACPRRNVKGQTTGPRRGGQVPFADRACLPMGRCVTLPDFYRDDLRRLEQASRRRTLAPRSGRDFSSNDYLGLARSEQLREAAIAALRRGVGVLD